MSAASEPLRDAVKDAEIEFHKARLFDNEARFMDRIKSSRWLNEHGIKVDPPEEEEEATEKPATGAPSPRLFDPSNARSIESELVAVAAIAADPAYQAMCDPALDPDDLMSDAMRFALRAIYLLRTEEKPVDRPFLIEAMRRVGLQNEAYAKATAAEVLDFSFDASSVRGHIDNVLKHAAVRKAIAVANDVVKSSQGNDLDADKFLDSALSKLAQVRDIRVSGDWPVPQLDGLPAVPFPLHVLPKPLADFALEISQLACCPPDYFLLPALTVAGLAIGRSVAIYLKPRWTECPALWTAFVGAPGTAKSAGVEQAEAPLEAIFQGLRLVHAIQKENVKRARQERAAKARSGQSSVVLDDDEECPKLRRLFVKDTTFEALGPIMEANPRGVAVVLDELAGLFNGMNQYKGGKGNDRDHFLSAWAGKPIAVDRKGQEGHVPIYIPRPFLAVSGPLQPARVHRIQDDEGTDDGFIDRFLVSYPSQVEQVWKEDLLTAHGPDDWERAVRKLWDREMKLDSHGAWAPHVVQFEPKAKARWIEWYNEICKEFTAIDFPSHLRGPWSKFRTHCARLALVIDQLHWAYEPEPKKPRARKSGASEGLPRDVSLASLEGAIELCGFFKTHFRRVYAEIQGERYENPAASAILDWVQKGNHSRFKESDVINNFRRGFAEKLDALSEAILWLEDRRCIRRVPARSGPGRPGGPTYEVNPSLLRPRAPNS